MSTAYVPIVEIQLQNDEDPSTFYTFNPSDFQYGSQSVTLDYFNSLILQQQQEDEAAAQATADQIAAQASSMASSDALLASGIALTQSFLATNTAGDVVQSNAISALEGNVSLLQDALSTISGGLPSYAPLLNPIFSDTITTMDLSMAGNLILGDESTISQEQLTFLSTISSNVQTQFAGVATAIATAESNTSALETSINSQVVDISGAISDIEAEVSTNSGSIASIEADIITLQSVTSSNSSNITLLQSDISSNTFDISLINASIVLLAPIDNPEFTTQCTMPQLVLNGSIITNSTNISPAEISYLNNASSNIQSQLDSATTSIALKVNALDAVLTGNATCVTQADANNSTRLANTQFVQTAIANLIGSAPSTMNTLQELAEALNNSPDAISSLTTTVGLKANILNATMTGNTSFANVIISGTTSFASSSIASAAINNSHFSTLTTNQTISGQKLFSNSCTVNRLTESIYNLGTQGSNSLSIDYSNGSIQYLVPFSATHMSAAITNLPTNNTWSSYALTLIADTSTYKTYVDTVTINGNSTTLTAAGGISTITCDPSATFTIQQLLVTFTGTSTPSHCISSINSFF